jgi:signal transduction histidine kinase
LAKSFTLDQHMVSGQAASQLVSSLLDALDRPLLVSDRSGRILFANLHAQDKLNVPGLKSNQELNLFSDVLRTDRRGIFSQLEGGEQEVNLPIEFPEGKSRARVRWLPEPDWLVVYVEPAPTETPADEAEMRQTVKDLLQEREITYRNLLAAYLRLQEVNRQKTVFLASAAHELKTPLAVMKGYYDLLLSGSLGKLSDRQRDILQESKESCDRLVRLVSMFLNYSALESGKLVLADGRTPFNGPRCGSRSSSTPICRSSNLIIRKCSNASPIWSTTLSSTRLQRDR